MDLVIVAIVAVSSAITLIVAFVLCARKQSFTIEHDYDPNYISPSVREKNSYRVRQVQRPNRNVSIENGHSKNQDRLSDINDQGSKKSAREVIVNNNVRVDVVKETSDGTHSSEGKDEIDASWVPQHLAKDSRKLARAGATDLQRETSKRKAPAAPVVQTDSEPTQGESPLSSASVSKDQKPTVSTPTPSATTPTASPSQGQKTTTGTTQGQSKQKTPNPKQTPTRAAAELIRREAPTKPSSTAASLISTSTNSLPRDMKTTPSPERVHYIKKSSTPPRKGSKRRAPVAPGQAQQVNSNLPKPADTAPSKKDMYKADAVTSRQPVPPSEDLNSGRDSRSDPEKPNRNSRNVLDRLPSLPQENSFDSGLDVKQSDITSVSAGSDIIDGLEDTESQELIEEDPYSIIKNKKLVEESVEHNVVDNGVSKNTSIEGGVTVEDGDHRKETTEAKDDGIVLELAPDAMTDGTHTETAVKAEPPYAKVIKRNKRNRTNVRVHFSLDNPDEIKRNDPPTPGPLVSMMNSEIEDGKLVAGDDMIIPEAASYD